MYATTHAERMIDLLIQQMADILIISGCDLNDTGSVIRALNDADFTQSDALALAGKAVERVKQMWNDK